MNRLVKTALGTVLAARCFGAGLVSADAPTTLKMAAILSVGGEEPWDGTFLAAWENARKNNPHGLEINEPEFTAGLWGDEAGAAARVYAKKGYDIVWLHSSYSDQVKKIQNKFPETLFVVSGSGNEGLGKNQYWMYHRDHEGAYLQGIVAGMTTKSNILGIVGTFPADDVWDLINGFFFGAQSVNSNIKKKVTFIESWWDPPKARESSNAQIAAGADNILMVATAFEACREHGIKCHGAYTNWIPTAPDVINSSFMISWIPHVDWVIDEWYQAKTNATPFAGNTEKRWFLMKDGAIDVAISDNLPADVKAKVAEAKSKIMSGELVVPVITDPVESD